MTTSIWEKQTFFAQQDVIIIGSGFTGLWTAFYLIKKNKKLKITVIDKGVIPTGASTRNAGFACFGSLTELLADEQLMGTDTMLELVEMRYNGLQLIGENFKKKDIDYEVNGGYELFTQKENYLAADLHERVNYMNELLKPVLKNKKTFKIIEKQKNHFGFAGVTHVIHNKSEGQLHPGKLTKSLLKFLLKNDVQVLNGLKVTGFEKQNGLIHIHTDKEIDLTATQLVICNNGMTKDLVPDISTKPARGQVLVTSEIEDLKWKGTFHYDEGFYYFRNLGKRVLLGGARNKAFDEEETFSLDTSTLIQNELENFLKEVIIPGKKFTIDHRWSGTMGMGANKQPDIKQLEENIFCAINLGGIGVAMAPLTGKKMAAMISA
jgi:gamma-glutamylputrescine oxidase